MYVRARKGIGYLPQEPSIFRGLSVEKNILAILETLGLTAAERQQRLRSLLAELSLTRLAKAPAYTLSGGERRRAEITRALVISPRFILLDEPFAGIDPIAVTDIQNIIFHLKERGIGVLITDHNVRETLRITDRAYIVHDGVIFRSGTPDSLAADEDVRGFIWARNSDWTKMELRDGYWLSMAISQKLHTKLVQKLILTPSLQQAIKLLPMSTLELSELLNQEMVENPMLEEVPTEELQPVEAAQEKQEEEAADRKRATPGTTRTTSISSATTSTTGIGRARRPRSRNFRRSRTRSRRGIALRSSALAALDADRRAD